MLIIEMMSMKTWKICILKEDCFKLLKRAAEVIEAARVGAGARAGAKASLNKRNIHLSKMLDSKRRQKKRIMVKTLWTLTKYVKN